MRNQVISPTANIDSSAQLDPDIEVGAYTIIGPDVRVGSGTRIGSHCVIEGPASIGRDNQIHAFSSIGGRSQDLKYQGEPTYLNIGDRNVIREYCTINRGTLPETGQTQVGHDNWIMAYVHIAHDCRVGHHVIMSNAASLAGHVQLDDWVTLGGFTLIHQFCRIGSFTFTAMGSGISRDVPPFIRVAGNPAHPCGLNSKGLRRRDFSPEDLGTLKKAYRILYRSGLRLEQAREALINLAEENPVLNELNTFLGVPGRGIVR